MGETFKTYSNQYSYSPVIMPMLWEILKMPDNSALISFNNKTYEITVKELAPAPITTQSKGRKNK